MTTAAISMRDLAEDNQINDCNKPNLSQIDQEILELLQESIASRIADIVAENESDTFYGIDRPFNIFYGGVH